MTEPHAHEGASPRAFWTATHGFPPGAPMAEDLRADACVVGAGIAGLTISYSLLESGRSVILLDDGPLAGGMTSFTTAHLTSVLDRRYVELERLHGATSARLAAESHTEAIRRIEAIVRREHIDCDFMRVDGYLMHSGRGDLLDRELAAALRAGLDASIVERMPWPPFDAGRCLRVANQAQFHPLRYVHGLSQAIVRMGGRVFTMTRAQQVEDGSPARVHVGRSVITADHVVIATHAPAGAAPSLLDRQAAFTSYVIGAAVQSGAIPHALYWDTETPYHYARLYRTRGEEGTSRGGDLLIVGGGDHRVGEGEDSIDRHTRLEHWARKRFPGMGPVAFKWSGQVLESRDGLGLIGPAPGEHGNVFIVTGGSGTGMTNATIAGMLITDLIRGRPNPWTALYDPGRHALHTVHPGAVATEARVALPEATSEDEIPEDHGAVVNRAGERLAVYRDGQGSVHRFLATCPHQGCQVQWNRVERTWDCSCRGSRFDRFGMVIRGPATLDLEPR